MELQREVMTVVEQTQTRSGWPVRRTLAALEIAPGSFYRWRKDALRAAPTMSGTADASSPPSGPASPARSGIGSLFELLPAERKAVIDYALKHSEVRHRELAWKMVDDGVCAVSSSSVYRVLREADLVCRWKPMMWAKGSGKPDKPTRPNERWQTDIRYTKVNGRNYYLLAFIDVYSRFVVHHELLTSMDAFSVAIAAQAALETLSPNQRPLLDPASPSHGHDASASLRRGPIIQSDHGSCFIAREFAGTLDEWGVGHALIRPHTPTDNGVIERFNRTLGEQIEQYELTSLAEARRVIAGIIEHYNHRRLHSSLHYLRPVDYYRGDPESLLAERRRKLQTARALRKQENLKLRQRTLPWPEEKTVTYRHVASVSL